MISIIFGIYFFNGIWFYFFISQIYLLTDYLCFIFAVFPPSKCVRECVCVCVCDFFVWLSKSDGNLRWSKCMEFSLRHHDQMNRFNGYFIWYKCLNVRDFLVFFFFSHIYYYSFNYLFIYSHFWPSSQSPFN